MRKLSPRSSIFSFIHPLPLPLTRGVRWMLTFSLLLALQTGALAQLLNPPVKQWQQSYDYTATHTTCSGLYSADWSYNITPTRDGGYISAGYSRIPTAGCAGLTTSPTLTKYDAEGKIEWHRVYQSATMPSTGITETTSGAFREVVELANGLGYLAVGYKVNSSGRRKV